MKEPADRLRQVLADLQSLELRAERRARHVPGVVFERARGGRFQVVDLGADARQVLLQRVHHALDEFFFFPPVVLLRQRDPIRVVGVCRADDRVAVRSWPRVGVIKGIGPARDVHGVERLRIEFRMGRGEEQVPDVGDGFALADAHVHLAAAAVEADGGGFAEELRAEVLVADQLVDRGLEVGVRQDGFGADRPAVADDAGHAALLQQDLLHQGVVAQVHHVGLERRLHLRDELVRAALEGVDALAHEIGEDDAERDGGVVQGGAVGVGDGLHQQAPHVGTAGKVPLEELAGGDLLVVVEVHAAGEFEELLDGVGRDLEVVDQLVGEVGPVEGRREGKLGVVEPDALELDDGLRDVRRPVLAAGLDHADGEAVERDVEDVPAFPLEPRRHAAEVVVMLQEQHGIAAGRQPIGGGQPGQARADDDRVVLGLDALEPVAGHYFFSTCRLAIEIPLSMEPTMPRNPWSLPQMNKLSMRVRPVLSFAGAPYTAPFTWPVQCLMVRGVKKSVNTTCFLKSGTNCSTS